MKNNTVIVLGESHDKNKKAKKKVIGIPPVSVSVGVFVSEGVPLVSSYKHSDRYTITPKFPQCSTKH